MTTPEEKKVSRRNYLQVAGGTIAGLVVGGVVGYMAAPSTTAPPTTVTTTATQTITATATATATPATTAPPAAPITLNIIIGSGSHFAPASHYKDLYQSTHPGITLNFSTAPHVEIRDKVLLELKSGTSTYDSFEYVYTFLPDFADPGYLQPVDDWIAASPDAKALYDDIIPPLKQAYTIWNGTTYGIAYDGDEHNYYYRKDLFTDPTIRSQFKSMKGYDLPTPAGKESITMQQYLDIGDFFFKTKAGGVKYGGSDLAKRGRMYLWWADRLAGFGGKWVNDDGSPAINNDLGLKALQHEIACLAFDPPGVLSYEFAEHETEWTKGTIPQFVQWPDAFLEVTNTASTLFYQHPEKIGMSICPGGAGLFATGWAFAFPKYAKHAKEAFDYFVWLNSPAQSEWTVTHAESGVQAYLLKGHFLNPHIQSVNVGGVMVDYTTYWKGLLYEANAAMLDFKVPGSSRFLDVLDENLSKALAGTMDPKAALDATADAWKSLNQQLFGQPTLPAKYVQNLAKPPPVTVPT
jgi:multiple sugar transport system substrate-binding protein